MNNLNGDEVSFLEEHPEFALISPTFSEKSEDDKEILFSIMTLANLEKLLLAVDWLTIEKNIGKEYFLKLVGLILDTKELLEPSILDNLRSLADVLSNDYPELTLVFTEFNIKNSDEKTRLLNAMQPEFLSYVISGGRVLYTLYHSLEKESFTRVVKKLGINHLKQIIRTDSFLPCLAASNDNSDDDLLDIIGTNLIARWLIEKSKDISALLRKNALPGIQKIITYLSKRAAIPEEFLEALIACIHAAPDKNDIVDTLISALAAKKALFAITALPSKKNIISVFYPTLNFKYLYTAHQTHAFLLFPLFIEKMSQEECSLFLNKENYDKLILTTSILNHVTDKEKIVEILKNSSLEKKSNLMMKEKYLFPLISRWKSGTKQELQILLDAVGLDLVREVFSDINNIEQTASLLNSLDYTCQDLMYAFFNRIDSKKSEEEIAVIPALFNDPMQLLPHLSDDTKRDFAFAGYNILLDPIKSGSLSISMILDWFGPRYREGFYKLMNLFTKNQLEVVLKSEFISRIQYEGPKCAPYSFSNSVYRNSIHRWFSMAVYFFALKSAAEYYLSIHDDTSSPGYKRAQGLLTLLNNADKPILTPEILLAVQDIAEKSGRFFNRNSLRFLILTALEQLPMQFSLGTDYSDNKLMHILDYWSALYEIVIPDDISLPLEHDALNNSNPLLVKSPLILGFASSVKQLENSFAKIKNKPVKEGEGEEMQVMTRRSHFSSNG